MQLEGLTMGYETEKSRMTPKFPEMVVPITKRIQEEEQSYRERLMTPILGLLDLKYF